MIAYRGYIIIKFKRCIKNVLGLNIILAQLSIFRYKNKYSIKSYSISLNKQFSIIIITFKL